MNPQVEAALLGMAGTIVAAVIGKVPYDKLTSSLFRSRKNIPEIMSARYKAVWNYSSGTRAPVNDTITLEAWTKNNQFKGFGDAEHGTTRYKYTMAGEVTPTRVLVFTYRAEDPTKQSNIGTATLMLPNDPDRGVFNGVWNGLEALDKGGATVYELVGGTVTMQNIR